MNVKEEALNYNREMKEFLTEIWSYVPKGRRKQLVKVERIRALLDRFGIPHEE